MVETSGKTSVTLGARRNKLYGVRLSEWADKRLREESATYGVSLTELIRGLIVQARREGLRDTPRLWLAHSRPSTIPVALPAELGERCSAEYLSWAVESKLAEWWYTSDLQVAIDFGGGTQIAKYEEGDYDGCWAERITQTILGELRGTSGVMLWLPNGNGLSKVYVIKADNNGDTLLLSRDYFYGATQYVAVTDCDEVQGYKQYTQLGEVLCDNL